MARTKPGNGGEVLAAVAAVGVVGGFLIWALTGKDPVEQQLQKVVTALNNSAYGKQWGGIGVAVLKRALSNTLAAELILLVDVVHAVEQFGEQHGWQGARKMRHAVSSVKGTFVPA